MPADPIQTKQDLGFARERVRDQRQRLERLEAEVQEAACKADHAKLLVDLHPDDREARALAEHAARALEGAAQQRDECAASIERLERHAQNLAETLAAHEAAAGRPT